MGFWLLFFFFLQYWTVDKFQTENKRQSPNSPCLDTFSKACCSHFFSCFPTGSSWRHGCYRRSGCSAGVQTGMGCHWRTQHGAGRQGAEWRDAPRPARRLVVGRVLREQEGGTHLFLSKVLKGTTSSCLSGLLVPTLSLPYLPQGLCTRLTTNLKCRPSYCSVLSLS